MSDIFVSIRGRILLNAEALNMTESIGNYAKHRRVPIVIPEKEGFTTYFVPAVSGESIAHGFQKVLAEEAMRNSLPVCKLCEKGIFLKSTNKRVLNEAFGKIPEGDLETFIIQNCLVEDVGGFLYAEEENVKRTSNFQVGYMIPAKEAVQNVVVDPQLHSRYALGTPFVTREQRGQMIYYVELSSALYTFSFDLDTRYIGKPTFRYETINKEILDLFKRLKRIKVVLNALKIFLLEMPFGAKKTRFLPTGEWESLVIGISNDIWTVSSPFSINYVKNTLTKKERVSHDTELFIYEKDKGSPEETIISAIEKAKQRVSGQ